MSKILIFIYHDKNKNLLKYIFEKEKSKSSNKNIILINELCSVYDTLGQIKNKLCVYGLNNSDLSSSDLYIWTNSENSPK